MNASRGVLIEQGMRVGVRGPRTLGGLISMHEGNWQHLLKLAPELHRLEGTTVSRVAGALDLFLTIIERAPYTTTLMLTYQFDRDSHETAEPNACLRVYHDAAMVELVSHCRRRRLSGVQPWRTGYAPDLYRRWEMNRFLFKWLRFCTYQGHLFLHATTRRVDTDPVT